MALIHNNLIINKNSDKYTPFLFNLISGRRKLLSQNEFTNACAMYAKQNVFAYNAEETELYNKLVAEKQFVNDEERFNIENELILGGYFKIKNNYADDLSFTIELTKSCNMACSYCYAKSRSNKNTSMTKEHVNGIYKFFKSYAHDQNKISEAKYITITGGEPLVNTETVEIIRYISSLWSEAKLYLFTNGTNIIKYYDKLPLGSIKEVHVSLDGVKDVHMKRRYSDFNVANNSYEDIIAGIKKLLLDGIVVRIQTVYDRTSYLKCIELVEFLEKEGISKFLNFGHDYGVVIDFSAPLDIDNNFNDKNDIIKFQNYALETGVFPPPVLPSAQILYQALNRPKNEPFMPRHQRCESKKFSKYFFSCDGNVYFCENVNNGKGVIGTYYPSLSLDNEATSKLFNRSVMNNDTCKKCAYKFVCLGGCPKSAETKNREMTCGIFADEESLDNLEFNYY